MGLTAIASDTAIGMPIATAVFRDWSTNSAVNDNPRKSTSSVNAIVRVQPCPSPTGSEARSGLVPRMALLVAGRIRAHCGFGVRESNKQCRGNGGDG